MSNKLNDAVARIKSLDDAIDGLEAELDDALSRAEAAENDSRAWEALAARAEAIVMVQQDKIAELEAQLASATVRFIDGVGYLTLPDPVAVTGKVD